MKILDLFCGSGGCSVGYHRAGFDVVGVDISPQPSYPFEFIQADAVEFLSNRNLLEFDAIHASPPCQAHSALTSGTNAKLAKLYPDLIPQIQTALDATGLPYIIENVKGSTIRKDLLLCGEMFGLRVLRHRFFQVNFPIDKLKHIKHRGRVAGYRHGEWFEGPYFAVYGDGGGKGTVEQWKDAMGIDWVNRKVELVEMIPPAYCEYIGSQLTAYLNQ